MPERIGHFMPELTWRLVPGISCPIQYVHRTLNPIYSVLALPSPSARRHPCPTLESTKKSARSGKAKRQGDIRQRTIRVRQRLQCHLTTNVVEQPIERLPLLL